MRSLRPLVAFLLAGVLVLALGVTAIVALTPTPPSASDAAPDPAMPSAPTGEPEDFGDEPDPSFETIEPGLIDQAEASGVAVEVVVLADTREAVAGALASGLEPAGGGLFVGALTAEALRDLEGTAGLRVGGDHPTSVGPVEPEAAPVGHMLTGTSVKEVDPNLTVARAAAGVQGTGQRIAILDSGVDPAASGLAGKVVHRIDFTEPTESCSDGGALDPHGHGTHVASIAAGSTATAYPGVAPGAEIVDLRVLACDGNGLMSWTDQALVWLLEHHEEHSITVANLSLGATGGAGDGTDATSILINRLVADGVFVAVAAGNNGDMPETVTVPGTSRFGTTVGAAGVFSTGASLAPYSGRGPVAGRAGVDILAAGSSIKAAASTALLGADSGFVTFSGTSMAAPYIAGLAALVRQQSPSAAPSGETCIVGVACPLGVVEESMSNGVQDAFQATDWFSPGVDSSSGIGLVAPAATLMPGSYAPEVAQNLSIDLQPNAFNVLRVPAHSEVTLALATDGPMLRGNDFDIMWVDGMGTTGPVQAPCNTTANDYGWSCSIAAGWTKQTAAVFLPTSTEDRHLLMRLTKATRADVTLHGFTGTATFASGLVASDITLDADGLGVIEVERVVASGAATTISLWSTPGITVASEVVLPAGDAGTTVTVPVAETDGHGRGPTESGDRVVLSTGSHVLGLVSVRTDESAAGQITADGRQVTWDELVGGNVVMAANGTMVAQSYQPEFVLDVIGDGEFFALGIFVVEPGSNRATPLALPTGVLASIDPLGISADGQRLLFRQRGANLALGETSARDFVGVFDRADGTIVEVGSASIVPRDGSLGSPVLSASGNEAAFVASVGGTTRVYFWRDDGTTTSLSQIIEFSSNPEVMIRGVAAEDLLLDVNEGGTVESRFYTRWGTLRETFNTGTWGVTALSTAGDAVSYPEGASLRCYLRGPRTMSTLLDSIGGFLATSVVGDACDSALVVVSDQTTGRLIRVEGETTTTLATDKWGHTSWGFDPTGTAVVTRTSRPLDPADTNGLVDLYRGAWGDPDDSGDPEDPGDSGDPGDPGGPGEFSDVPAESQFATEITWLAAQGISTGYPDGTFRPLASVNRDAMAAFLYRLAGEPEFAPPEVSPFRDVPTSNQFYTEIAWLASVGISTGWDVGGGQKEFRPLERVARDAMAAFLYRYAEEPEFEPPAVSPFRDVPASSQFYRHITWLAEAGISTGWDVGGGLKEFRPLESVARDAMAAFMYRFDQLEAED